MIDFHTHILPFIDDGSKSVEQSLCMLREEYNQGIKQVVLTPHFYANYDNPKRFLERREESYKRLSEAVASNENIPEIFLGAEIHFFDGISDCEFLSDMAVDFLHNGKRCVMIEMPIAPFSERMLNEIDGIWHKRRLVPIIAHIDRYIEALGMKKIPERLYELPVLIQANASFFLKRANRKTALNMLREGRIHLLGSDCHDMDSRKPNLGEAVEIINRRGDEKIIDTLNSYVMCQTINQ